MTVCDETQPALARLRERIDEIDGELVALIARRFAVTEQVGELKARVALPAYDPTREAQQLQRLRELSRRLEVNPQVVGEVFEVFNASREGSPSYPGRWRAGVVFLIRFRSRKRAL